jgi:xanthine dehydrogenase molybdopterin-binding subunit B
MAAAMAADPANNVMAMGAPMTYGNVEAAMAAADTVVSGRFRMGSQYHFHMETHVCIARPTEDGLDLLVPTQVRITLEKKVICFPVASRDVTN